jgi:hypothetical protein
LNRNAVKELFLTSLHLGDYLEKSDQVPIPFLSKFQTEMKSNAKALLKYPECALHHSRAITKKKWNPLGSMIAVIMQQEESKIMRAKVTFTEKSLKVVSYILDGHLREIGEIDQEACTQYVKDQTGYRVTFVTKPHPLPSSPNAPQYTPLTIPMADSPAAPASNNTSQHGPSAHSPSY